jgi:hypothetical protein
MYRMIPAPCRWPSLLGVHFDIGYSAVHCDGCARSQHDYSHSTDDYPASTHDSDGTTRWVRR